MTVFTNRMKKLLQTSDDKEVEWLAKATEVKQKALAYVKIVIAMHSVVLVIVVAYPWKVELEHADSRLRAKLL